MANGAMALHSVGKTVRLARLFHRDGKSMMLAIDHGKSRGMVRGLEDTRNILNWVMQARADAVLLNPGMFRRYVAMWTDRTSPGVILALDTHLTNTLPGMTNEAQSYRLLSTVEEAVALGADAVKVVLAFGRRDLEVHADNVKLVSQVVRESEGLGIPVMVEPVLWGDAVEQEHLSDPSVIANICRIAVELGADVVKAPYATGIFADLCKALPVPITLLGGATTNALEDLYGAVRRGLAEGVRGVTFGRNIWQQQDPEAVWRDLYRIVHANG